MISKRGGGCAWPGGSGSGKICSRAWPWPGGFSTAAAAGLLESVAIRMVALRVLENEIGRGREREWNGE